MPLGSQISTGLVQPSRSSSGTPEPPQQPAVLRAPGAAPGLAVLCGLQPSTRTRHASVLETHWDSQADTGAVCAGLPHDRHRGWLCCRAPSASPELPEQHWGSQPGAGALGPAGGWLYLGILKAAPGLLDRHQSWPCE